MRRKGTMFIVFIICIVMNIPVNHLSLATANPGEDYPYQPTDKVIVQALNYLRNEQNNDGSIGGFTVTSWAAMAIAAAENDAHDWGDLVEYMQENAERIEEDIATDWERQVLAIVACNEDPTNFGGINYLAKLKSFFDGEQIGSRANLYDDFFGILALISAGVDKDSSIVQTVRFYIKQEQNGNGGWGDIDATAVAVMALMAAGEDTNSKCIDDALIFIKTMQVESGGFQSWGNANAASTSWAVNAIVAARENPTSVKWECNGNSPVDFLLDLQQDNGGFNWAVDQNMNPEWMTSYVIPALLGKPYPVKIQGSGGQNDESGDDNQGNEGDGDNGNDDPGDGYQVNEWSGYVRIEGHSDTIWAGEVCFSDSTISALNDSSGEVEDFYIPYPSVLGALDEASQLGSFSYFVMYYPNWDAFYIKTIANDSDWWHYWVDYNLPMVGVGAYELSDNDVEVLFGYLEDWSACALRIFTQKHIVNVSEEFTVSVLNETLFPVAEAVVYVDSLEYVTDENGNVSISIDSSGEYEFYAEKDGYVRSEKASVKVKKSVEIIKPEDNIVYLLNKKTRIQHPTVLIIGHIDVEVNTTNNIEKVEFYINNNLKNIDTESPFKWRLNQRAVYKKATIKVKAYIKDNENIFYIQGIIKYFNSLFENHSAKYAINSIMTYLHNLELPELIQSDVDEKEVRIINILPNIHIF